MHVQPSTVHVHTSTVRVHTNTVQCMCTVQVCISIVHVLHSVSVLCTQLTHKPFPARLSEWVPFCNGGIMSLDLRVSVKLTRTAPCSSAQRAVDTTSPASGSQRAAVQRTTGTASSCPSARTPSGAARCSSSAARRRDTWRWASRWTPGW